VKRGNGKIRCVNGKFIVIMKYLRLINFLVTFFFSKNILAQVDSFFHFSNVVYYTEEGFNENKLVGSNLTFGKKINERFFDTLLKEDSLNIRIDEEIHSFYQKKRDEVKEHREFILYSKRLLEGDGIQIKRMKIIRLEQELIVAEASLLYNNKPKKKEFRIIEIQRNQIEGLFIGPNKKHRTAVALSAFFAGIAAAFLIF